MSAALFAETTTLGLRRHRVERGGLERARGGRDALRYGAGEGGAPRRARGGGSRSEYDDCLARARERGVAVREVMTAAIAAHRTRR